jgi:hypothetical protein
MRARSIKPGICDNELLGTADPFCTLLFERLWMMADREGRLEDRPLRIKAQAFPYREGLDIETLLVWLTTNGFILRYTVGTQRFIQVIKFLEHQKPHQNEKPSVLPPSSDGSPSIQGAPTSTTKVTSEHNQGTKHLALTPSSLTPDSGLLTPDSGFPDRRSTCAVEPAEFVEIRRTYPRRAGGQRWGDALKSFRRRVQEGEQPQTILAGVRRYAEFTRSTSIESTEHVQQAATFLGENRGYLELWHAPPRQKSAVEQARDELRQSVNGHGNGSVVSEQTGPATGSSDLGSFARLLR